MINWSKHFDKIICLSLANNTERRKEAIADFTRVGIMDSGIFEWKITVDNIFYKYIWTNPHLNSESWWLNDNYKGALNCTLGHYEILKECQVLDYDKVLVLEDDCRFLKNENEISTILENIPNEYDICLFDKFIPVDKTSYFYAVKNRKINDHYFDFSTTRLWSCACYAVSKKGMTHIINSQEKKFVPADHSINKISNQPDEFQIIRIAPFKNMAIQEFQGKTYKTEADRILDQQIYSGIADRNEYNVKL